MLKDKLSLFRQTALENLAAPDQLDELVKVTSPKGWIILYALGTAVFFIVLWGMFGSIPTRVYGQGILLAAKGSVYNVSAPTGASKILQILVKSGDHVKKNQIVAYLEQPDLTQQIKIKLAYVNELNNQYKLLNQQAINEVKNFKQQVAEKNLRLQKIVDIQTENLNHTEEIVKIRQYALKRGIDTKLGVNVALKEASDVKREVEQALNQLAQSKIDENSFIDQWQERLRSFNLKIKEEQYNLDKLLVSAKTSSVAKSPITGVITSVRYNEGDAIKEGETLMNVAIIGQGIDAMVFIPAENGKRVQQNMDALVEPTTVKKEEFGSMKGKVIAVADYPSTAESMMTILQNKELIEQFSQKKVQIAVRIKLLEDAKTFSKFRWTSSKGPQQFITPGTLVAATITVRTQAPISLIIPALRKLFSDW